MSAQPRLDTQATELGEPPGIAIAGRAQPIHANGVPTISRAGSVVLIGAPRTGSEVVADAPRDLIFPGEVLSVRFLTNGEPRVGVFRCQAVDPVVGLRDRATLFLLGEPKGTQQRGAFRAKIELEVDAMVAAG